MQTSTVTTKGQVTIPADMRKRLNLVAGDRVGFEWVDGEVRLVKREDRVEAAFGLIKSDSSVSDEDMEQAIRVRGAGGDGSA
jgi:AbrB family looped-hinge helix DNA binding protein